MNRLNPFHILLIAGLMTLTPAASAGEAKSWRLVEGRRLVTIEMSGPKVMVLVFVDHDEATPPGQEPTSYAVDGRPPVKVGRVSRTVYEEKCVDWKNQR